jgi:hypothetical protein
MAQQKSRQSRRVQLESLAHINLDAAGLDVGASEIWACVLLTVTRRQFVALGPSPLICML